MRNILWCEKYRPKKIDDIVGQDMSIIKNLIKDPMNMPHLLFVSKSPGTGKTTTAHAIRNELGIATTDFMTCNSSDDRKIDFIRNNVKTFAMTMRSNKNVPKIILMDEFDGMLTASQDMMKGLIEKYHTNVRFIFTANDEEKIIDPIKSRCAIIRFKEPQKPSITGLLMDICKKENVHYTLEGITKIVDMYYPDMRSMINKLQELAPKGVTEEFIKTKSDLDDKFFAVLKTRNPYEARKFIIENNMANSELVREFLNKAMEQGLEIDQIRTLVFAIAETDYRMAVGSDKEIQVFSLILKWLEVVK